MKYSILGFSQEIVLSLQKERDGKILKLEVLDLLILKDIADFMNRPNIIRYSIDDKTYFSIQYAVIIEDLPIIGIKKQALVDRIDKMVFLGVLEKKVMKNQSGTWVAFRMGEQYEKLLYTCTSSEIHHTSSTLQVQECSTTTHNTNITNNSINKEEVYKTWRNDFETYLQIVYEAQAKLLNDIEFKKQKELYHENLDYELSLEKMVKEYWATDVGWEQKKKNKQTKNIDMVATLKKAFDYSCNRVYKKINTRQKQNVVEPIKTPDNPFYTVVPLNSKLKFIDKRGTLNDGTFVEDGYRYYLSQKDGMKYSIPPKAEPMPHQDCEYDIKSNKWYEPKQTQKLDGLFLF